MKAFKMYLNYEKFFDEQSIIHRKLNKNRNLPTEKQKDFMATLIIDLKIVIPESIF